MTHEERMTMLRKIEHVKNDEDVDLDFKAKILFLIEDLISKVEALTDRTPDFRTKDHSESPSEMAARVQFKTLMEDREGRRKVVDSGKEIDHGE